MAIDTLNSNSITISRESTVFKVYYLQKEKHILDTVLMKVVLFQ
jgi:hypothetical protein